MGKGFCVLLVRLGPKDSETDQQDRDIKDSLVSQNFTVSTKNIRADHQNKTQAEIERGAAKKDAGMVLLLGTSRSLNLPKLRRDLAKNLSVPVVIVTPNASAAPVLELVARTTLGAGT